MIISIRNSILLLSILNLFFTGCNKDDDEPHPAEVTSSTFTVTSWTYTSPAYHAELNVPELTSSKLNSAGVMVYLKSGSNWVALPFTQYNNSGSNYMMGFNSSTGSIQITWIYNTSLSTGDNPNIFYGTNCEFKVVIISSTAREANPDLDLSNYEEVKKAFQLYE